jgi:hypothetical protein
MADDESVGQNLAVKPTPKGCAKSAALPVFIDFTFQLFSAVSSASVCISAPLLTLRPNIESKVWAWIRGNCG